MRYYFFFLCQKMQNVYICTMNPDDLVVNEAWRFWCFQDPQQSMKKTNKNKKVMMFHLIR